jgi:hypothetical protein
MLTVHVRVNDESTGKPIPARLRLRDDAGAHYPPLGRLADFTTAPGVDVGGQVQLGHERFAFIGGTCEARLPAGALNVEATHGFEYVPLVTRVNLAAGKMSLRLSLQRWADWSKDGWYSGDVRAHDLSPHDAALEGAAEGLAVVQLLARERPPSDDRPGAVSNLAAFSGTAPALSAHGCLVAVNTLNSHPVLGTVSLLNSHRPVFPLRFGAPGQPDHWSVADWCDQCHRKAGLVVWPDLPRLRPDHLQGEALAALVLGKVDAYEVGPLTEPHPDALVDYYRLLDCGLRPVLVGGSGKDSNAAVLGNMRTYARLGDGEALTAAGWIDAVRAGRTFVSTGPLIALDVAGQGPGAVVAVERGQRVRLKAEAHSAVAFEHLEVLVNGEVVACKPASGNQLSAVVETDLVCEQSAWIAATCHSPVRQASGACVLAHTAPVYVEVRGVPMRPVQETVAPLLDVLAATRAWVVGQARCETDRQREHLLAGLDEARDRLSERMKDEG